MENALPRQEEPKLIKKSEFILYLVAVFFYTNMTGMVGAYRNDYLVNVLQISSGKLSLYRLQRHGLGRPGRTVRRTPLRLRKGIQVQRHEVREVPDRQVQQRIQQRQPGQG
ncbi:MAG: hypothetical protein IKH12_09975, partial [Clostridia bacterium]|nr:hypothetical protein [Clostridia bacterium]